VDELALRSLIDRVIARDPRAIARAITGIETGSAGAAALVAALAAHGKTGYRIGITGPPGAGKSTLVSRLVSAFRRDGSTVAVLAVDPSSPYTGGALLGDRVRMQEHAADPNVFIRSMATRGHLGGLAAATIQAAGLLDAAGFDIILIETVGVGQDEVEVIGAADVCVVTLVPGAGDDVQALKAGVMEIADVFVINKADLPGADAAAAAVEGMLGLEAREPERWRPPVLRVSSASGEGVPALVEALQRFRTDPEAIEGRRRASRATARRGAVLDHVAIATGSTTGAAALFQELFGLAASPVESVPGQQVRVQFLETAGARLELIEPTEPHSTVAAFLERRGPGLHHIALRVADLEGTLATLRARGIRLVDERPRAGAGGTTVAFVHPSGIGGVLVELVAREDEHDAHR
jgi:LAO/AO transport system kinase